MIQLRSRFQVQGGSRFLSHLDTLKAMERALRRAGLPVVHSQGFNPHPQIAFGPPRAVGLASQAEYLDVQLAEEIDPDDFRRRLNGQMPAGLEILETRAVPLTSKALMAVLNCAVYQVDIHCLRAYSQAELAERVAHVFSQGEIVIQRNTPKGIKKADIRPGIWQLAAQASDQSVQVTMEVRLGGEGNVRPGEVVSALGLEGCQIAASLRTGLLIRQPDGTKEEPWKSL